MADKVAFELVAPERLLASVEADMVVVPGEEGDFGVLPGHSAFVSMIRPGVLSIYEGDSVKERIFIEGGFAEVNPQGLIVLAEAAFPISELDLNDARSALSDAQDDLGDAKDPSDSEREELERLLHIAQTRVDVLEAS